MRKHFKKIFLTIIFAAIFGLGFFLDIKEIQAATYYSAPSGSGVTCSSELPCTLNYAVNTKASAGDAVTLNNGTYTGVDGMLIVTKSGSAGLPITIKAQTYGNVIIDGGNVRPACSIKNNNYVDVEGIVCKNPMPDAADCNSSAFCIYNATNINIRKVSAYGTGVTRSNASTVSLSNVANILLEDMVVMHGGRVLYDILSGDAITMRRCFGGWDNNYGDSPMQALQVYGTNKSIFENNVFVNKSSQTSWMIGGILTQSNGPYTASNNKFRGNVLGGFNNNWAHVITANSAGAVANNSIIDDVYINGEWGLSNQSAGSTSINHLTIYDMIETAINVKISGGAASSAALSNSLIAESKYSIYMSTGDTSLVHTHNDLYNNANNLVLGTGEITTQPTYDTTTYGNGAYLIKPSNLATSGEGGTHIGAEVLYKYQDGVLSGDSLWPWPMESRICAETGYSVTYENGYSDCAKGGGLWKTLDGVYINSDINSDGKVNIKDIQACVKAITNSQTDQNIIAKCQALATPDTMTNIKDIQVIIRAIINPSSTPQDSPFGLHPADAQGSYSAAVDMGARWHRPSVYMMWSSVQADINSSNYDFSFYDNYYGSVSQEINILANIVPDNPKRLNNYLLPNSFLPQDEEKYLQFVKVAIERYDGDGTADMPGLNNPIKYWQVGNEPNDRGDREDFAQLQKMTYDAIKSVCPECKVLIGGAAQPTVLGGGGEFVFDSNEYFSNFSIEYEPYLAELAGTGFDIFDFHWYGNAEGDYKKIQAVYDGINSRLKSYGYANVDSWVTEMGAYSGEPIDAAYGYQSEKQQASDYVKRFIYPLSIGIKKVFPAFGLVEGFKNNDGYFDHTGFIYDGKGSNDLGAGIKKLSYYSYKKMTETLEGSDWNNIQTIQEANGVYIYKFTKAGKPIWVAWNDNANSQTITLDIDSANSVKITEAVPKYETGQDVAEYSTAFNSETKTANNNQISLILGDKPVFIEE